MELTHRNLPRGLPHRKTVISLSREYEIPILTAASFVGRDALLPLLQHIATAFPEEKKLLCGANRGLYFAVENDCPQSVEALILVAGASPFRCIRDSTATHIAAARGKCKALGAILRLDHRLEATGVFDEYDFCPVHVAAWRGQREAVRMLVRHDAAALVVKVSGRFSTDGTFNRSSSRLYFDFGRECFSYFTEGSPACERGSNVAHVAAEYGQISVLEEVVRLAYAVECGPPVRPFVDAWPNNRIGFSRLRMELQRSSAVIDFAGPHVRVAHEDVFDKVQSSALYLRESQYQYLLRKENLEDEVNSFVEQLVLVSARDHVSESKHNAFPLFLGVTVTDFLEAQNEKGQTPLLCAARRGEERTVRCLARLGANIRAKGNALETALHEAARCGNNSSGLLEMLVHEYNFDVGGVDETGQTALHYAGSKLRVADEAIPKLLSLGADIESKCFYNQTPLYVSTKNVWYIDCSDYSSPFMQLLGAGADSRVLCGWRRPQCALARAVHTFSFDTLPKFLSYAKKKRKHHKNRHILFDLLLSREHPTAEARSARDVPPSKKYGSDEWAPIPTELLSTALGGFRHLDAGVVDLLVKAGANVNYVNSYGKSILHLAAANDDYANIIEILVNYGAKVNARIVSVVPSDPSNWRTPLNIAATWNSVKCLRALISAGARWDLTEMRSPLDDAVRNGSLDAAKALIDCGADLCSRTMDGYTPLHIAALHCETTLVELLLKAGCPVDVRTNDLLTPLHFTITEKSTRGGKPNLQIVRILLRRGADIGAVDSEGFSPLHHAVLAGDKKMMKLLIEMGAEINLRSADGCDPFLFAAEEGKLRCMAVLLSHGARLDSRCNSGETALHKASRNGHADIVQYLLRYGADPFAVDDNGVSAMQLAVRSEEGATSRALLESIGGIDAVSQKAVFEFESPCVSQDGLGAVDENSASRRAERHMECEMDNARARCGICYLVFRTGAVVRRLGCGHAFHDGCIASWLSSTYGTQQMSCPMCRMPLLGSARRRC